jgi:hypothetical protein
MLFNSDQFLIFLVVVYGLYLLLRERQQQNLMLLIASYVFYGAWDWRFLSLIVGSTLIDYVAAARIDRSTSPRARRGYLVLSLVFNLGMLGFFKYYNFGIESMAELLRGLGLQPHLSTLRIILPVGISFYTFQTISYTVDVYRGERRHTDNLLDFALPAPQPRDRLFRFRSDMVLYPSGRIANLMGPWYYRSYVGHDLAAAADDLLDGLLGDPRDEPGALSAPASDGAARFVALLRHLDDHFSQRGTRMLVAFAPKRRRGADFYEPLAELVPTDIPWIDLHGPLITRLGPDDWIASGHYGPPITREMGRLLAERIEGLPGSGRADCDGSTFDRRLVVERPGRSQEPLSASSSRVSSPAELVDTTGSS